MIVHNPQTSIQWFTIKQSNDLPDNSNQSWDQLHRGTKDDYAGVVFRRITTDIFKVAIERDQRPAF